MLCAEAVLCAESVSWRCRKLIGKSTRKSAANRAVTNPAMYIAGTWAVGGHTATAAGNHAPTMVGQNPTK